MLAQSDSIKRRALYSIDSLSIVLTKCLRDIVCLSLSWLDHLQSNRSTWRTFDSGPPSFPYLSSKNKQKTGVNPTKLHFFFVPYFKY